VRVSNPILVRPKLLVYLDSPGTHATVASGMGLSEWFRGKTPLQAAIARGCAGGGDLKKELDDLEDEYEVKSRGDAIAICEALEKVLAGAFPSKRSPLHKLVAFFQQVSDPDCAALDVLRKRGTLLLAQIADRSLAQMEDDDETDLLFVLKILAMCGTEERAEMILRAAKLPYKPDGYLWSVIFRYFSSGHPMTERVFDELSDPLPPGFIAISLLDAANQYFIEGGEGRHPFDSDQGVDRLQSWLRDLESEHFSYATSATAALPFLKQDKRDGLLELAMDHPDPGVQIESAWAAAKLGHSKGIARLAACCQDVNQSKKARHYLEELGRADAAPPATPEFEARAEFAQWLAHPSELGQAPDSVEITDQRTLRWPPEFESKPFWLVRYVVKSSSPLEDDQVGTGLVGSVTFCLFSYDLEQRPPEDGYAIHCSWEMEGQKLLKREDIEEGPSDYDSMLSQWTGGPLNNASIKEVAEMDPTLKYPRTLVAVASAHLHGEAGWVILDGADSKFYRATDFRSNESASSVLSIHIGRRLLGLAGEPEPERKCLIQAKTERPPEATTAAYESLIARSASWTRESREAALRDYRLLRGHFEAYVDAMCKLHGGTRAQHVALAYEKLLQILLPREDILGEELHFSTGVLIRRFDDYANALLELNRPKKLREAFPLFIPRWDHNLGYLTLGNCAFKAGDFDTAEQLFVKLRDSNDEWQDYNEMALLAEIWTQRGKQAEAKQLLLEALQWILKESRTASGSDRKRLEEVFQNHRAAFLKLFPQCAEELTRRGITGIIEP
jgi:hypothetical protein